MNLKSSLALIVALFLSTSILKSQNADINQILQISDSLIEINSFSSAKIQLLTAYSLAPTNDKVLNDLAYCYYQTGKYKTAIAYANKLIQQNSDLSGDGFVVKSASFEATGKTKRALRIYKTGIEKYPENHRLNQNLSLFYLKQKEYKSAEYYATQAVLTSKSDIESHMLLAQISEKQGQRAKALLAVQYYALLEQEPTKSIDAYMKVKKLWWQIATKEGNELVRKHKSNTDFDGFGEIENCIINSNSNFTLNDTAKIEIEMLTTANRRLFKLISEQKQLHTEDFWWTFYGEFYAKLYNMNYTQEETLYIAQNKHKAEVLSTISSSIKTFSAFTFWLEKELNKTL